jgi:hypothetical protein
VQNVNEDLVSVEKWLIENEMVAHPKKSDVMKIGSRPALMNAGDVVVNLNSQILKDVSAYKYLGVLMGTLLTWNEHLSYICKRVYPKVCLLNRTSSFLPRYVLLNIFKRLYCRFLTMGAQSGLTVVNKCQIRLKGFKIKQ